MKIVTISGNHNRHLYYLNSINAVFPLSGAVLWERENIVPEPPVGLSEIDRVNFIRHFANREAAEATYFGSQNEPGCPILKVTGDLNSQKTVKFIEKIVPDVVLIFGSGLIKEPLVSALPEKTLNMHLGLSPRYRGAATLFWPFYFLEPAYAGATFHYIVAEPDAGAIVHQVVPPLSKKDHIHDVACKTVIESTKAAIKLLEIVAAGKKWKSYVQKSTGKNFLGKDFKPEHLRLIYTTFNDDIVKAYLEGSITQKKPTLIKQF